MTPPLPERKACLFWPGDHLRHDDELYVCRHVSVSTEEVAIIADRIVDGAAGDRVTLRFAPGEIVRAPASATINSTPANDTTKSRLLLAT